MKRWSAMSCSQLLSRLSAGEENDDVEFESEKYQVEVKCSKIPRPTYTLLLPSMTATSGELCIHSHPASLAEKTYSQEGEESPATGNLSVTPAYDN